MRSTNDFWILKFFAPIFACQIFDEKWRDC